MLTASGKYYSGDITETGEYILNGITETGEYAGVTVIKPGRSLSGVVTMQGPGYSGSVSAVSSIFDGFSAAASILLTLFGPTNCAAVASTLQLSISSSAQLSSLLALFGPGSTSFRTGITELSDRQHSQLSAPIPHGSTVTIHALQSMGLSAINAIAAVTAIADPGHSGSVSTLLALSGNHSAQSALLALGGYGQSASRATTVALSDNHSTLSALASIDPVGTAAVLSVPVPLYRYAGAVSAAVPLALAEPLVITGLLDYRIALDGVDITKLAESCSINQNIESMFSTVTISLPVALDRDLSGQLDVTFAGVTHLFNVEDTGFSGPSRTLWGRSIAARTDAPFAADSAWDETTTPAATAADLALLIAAPTPLAWQAVNWVLPPTWSLSGTPAEALQQLAAAVGAVVQSTPAGGLTVVPRYSVRPVFMSAATPVAEITRETAIEFSAKQQHGKKWGSITVNGYDPSADLPDLEVEETDPAHGLPVHVKARWKRINPPPFSKFLTDGTARLVGSGIDPVEEQIVFEEGMATVRYPMRQLISFYWIGRDGGDVWWLENGDSRELEMTDPQGFGVAMVSYTTGYQRFQLTGQIENIVQFGLSVAAGATGATVSLASGGAAAPQLIAPLLGDTAACIAAGTAALDAERDLIIIDATVPLTGPDLIPGAMVRLQDELAGVVSTGQLNQVTTLLEPLTTKQQIEAVVCS